LKTLRMMQQIAFHPYNFFEGIQESGRIKWLQGIAVMLLVYLARMISIIITGYTFQTKEPYQISALHELIWILVPWFTFTLSNWAVSTILDGEGKFKEIFVGSAFALVPYIILIVPISLLSRWLSLDESGIYSFLTMFTLCWAGWLLLVGIKILHDFEIGKLIWIVLITIVGILIIWYVGILMFGLINQLYNFIADIIKELSMRA
jgi:hypothetical protein